MASAIVAGPMPPANETRKPRAHVPDCVDRDGAAAGQSHVGRCVHGDISKAFRKACVRAQQLSLSRIGDRV
jgi:hypothetical protein